MPEPDTPANKPDDLDDSGTQPATRRYTLDEWPPQEIRDLAETALEADKTAVSAIEAALNEINAKSPAKKAEQAYDAIRDGSNLERGAIPGYQAGPYTTTNLYDGALGHMMDKSGEAAGEIHGFLYAFEENADCSGGDLSLLAEEIEEEYHMCLLPDERTDTVRLLLDDPFG